MDILLIEDDPDMAVMLRQTLTTSGFGVDLARDGRIGLEKALEHNHRAIVLDIMLPQIDGFHVCAELRRQHKTTPILMITARDAVMDRVRGLELGADDYLPKPFDVREFVARVRALIRRDRVIKSRILRVRNMALDSKLRSATIDGRPFPLTRVEYGLLEVLVGQIGRVALRESMLEIVWQDREPGSNKLEVAMRSLRRKLAAAGHPDLVRTVYGCGYTIDETEEPE